jgi:hypothetical protein|tara:strand:- start:572 stop:727 length:156 start_codon:yes stop_codon:yes gene_type:complete
MEEETNEDIKKQVEELKELLQTIEVEDKESQDDMVYINEQLNKVLKKFNNK